MKITVKTFVAEKRSAGKQQGVAQRHAEQACLTHGYLLFSGKTDLKDPVQEDLSSLSHLWNVPNDLLNVSTTRGWSFAVDCLHVYSLLSDDPHGFFSVPVSTTKTSMNIICAQISDPRGHLHSCVNTKFSAQFHSPSAAISSQF